MECKSMHSSSSCVGIVENEIPGASNEMVAAVLQWYDPALLPW